MKSVEKLLQFHGMRFVPYCNSSAKRQPHGGESIISCLTYNSVEDESNFLLQKTGSTGTGSRRNSSDAEIYPLASPVNDFCFTLDSTVQCCGEAGVRRVSRN